MKTLWDETVHRRKQRRKRNVSILTSQKPYSITGTGNDCGIIGHTLNAWDLSGCTTCMDCKVKVFCPGCTPKHPQDETAIPVLCERHEHERTVHHAAI